jgi:hypothetical protein
MTDQANSKVRDCPHGYTLCPTCPELSPHGRAKLVEQLDRLEREFQLRVRCARMDIGEDPDAERDVDDGEATLKLLRLWIDQVNR